MTETKYILKETDEETLSSAEIISSLKKHAKTIILFSVIIGILSGAFTFFQKDYYTSNAVGTSELFQDSEIRPVMDIISSIIHNRSAKSISQILDISEETSQAIKDMSVSDLQSGENQQYIFDIKITTTDSSKIDEIFERILYGIESNSYLANKFTEKVNDIDTLILKTEQQISDLNKLKTQTLKLSSEQNNGVVIFPTNIYSEIVELEERLLKLKNQANDISIVEYIQRPPKPEKAAGPNRMMTTLLAFFSSIAIGIFIVIARLVF
ncbi:Wzz/FepE/Etk N-terminal domain-containing protein [Salibacteraceae bacterium]|jgi:uncharacterized protein involved in exopolysaccharide biosynthesis|nr:Wzz/FepE/Etk N-terminal domain-containing protein [Salibacteraceae bacterium]MDB9709768.1 Wzz/FepE/Etk N-terminal domain-containing protein [Salibacteraceae bacterium]HAQ69953.1 hypothetical protein [Flavobacteriales bacterium]